MRKFPAIVLALLPFTATAEMHEALGSGVLVSDPAHCAVMQEVDAELHIMNVLDAGGETLTSLGIAAEEVDCWFDEEIDINWQGGPPILTLGVCHVADRMLPKVYAINMMPEVPGLVTVWEQGADEPYYFHACPAP